MNDSDYFGKRARAERAAALAAKDMASFRVHMDLANAYERRTVDAEHVEGFLAARQFHRHASAPAGQDGGLSLAEGQARQQHGERRHHFSRTPMPWLRN
jgi:hypothetical protein